jgi:hypothetical protein
VVLVKLSFGWKSCPVACKIVLRASETLPRAVEAIPVVDKAVPVSYVALYVDGYVISAAFKTTP